MRSRLLAAYGFGPDHIPASGNGGAMTVADAADCRWAGVRLGFVQVGASRPATRVETQVSRSLDAGSITERAGGPDCTDAQSPAPGRPDANPAGRRKPGGSA